MNSFAEQQAELASQRQSFYVNISDLRQTVTNILAQIGRTGPFESYTRHDISHIDEMLKSLDWIIPIDTKKQMSPADWFLTVVSIFLHDIGLLVTRDEFSARNQSEFPLFVEQRLYSGQFGLDYRQRVMELPESERDLFLYEEFVRANHGKRARAWIEGRLVPQLGVAPAVGEELNRIFASLDPMVRSDIAVIVESHTLDDLKDLNKYPIERPYANTPEDTANVQYCSILVRSADLLQITSDRAPTTLLKLINPRDPVSQVEWVKQNGVRRVKNQTARDKDGHSNEDLHQDTVEVFALFRDQNGYFGLNALLDYAEKQLAASSQLAEISRIKHGTKHSFPWRKIDREQIRTEGFLKRTFKFEIDQGKILDLLTGHTLYNNSLVVVRELVQNALDAVRLFAAAKAEQGAVPHTGKIAITWDPSTRLLEVLDNGTGMSLDTIENHLLKAGASKYQDADFRKQNPNFHAISRFGIGALSAFMVADEVEILTTEEGDIEAREISLRSVHGHYLIRVWQKNTDAQARSVGTNGTRVRLRVRPSAHTNDLLHALQSWVVVPRCQVTFTERGKEEIVIGHNSAKEALESRLITAGYSLDEGDPLSVRVVHKDLEGTSIAYALQWSQTYKEWSFLRVAPTAQATDIRIPLVCVCVQGIAVEFVTPGFRSQTIFALSDSTGASAPQTNVARTALEENDESQKLGDDCYRAFVDSVKHEVDRLQDQEKFTIRRATNEAVFLVGPLGPEIQGTARYPNKLKNEVSSLPVFLMEGQNEKAERVPHSLASLQRFESFWTVEGELVRSAESLLAQFSSNIPIHTAVENLSEGRVLLPRPLLCNFSSLGRFQSSLFERFQITEVNAEPERRQVAFLWKLNEPPQNWVNLSTVAERPVQSDPRLYNAVRGLLANAGLPRGSGWRCWGGTKALKVSGLEKFGAIRVYRSLLLLPDQPLSQFLNEVALNEKDPAPSLFVFLSLLQSTFMTERSEMRLDNLLTELRIKVSQLKTHIPNLNLPGLEEFYDKFQASNLSIYDPFLWSSRANALYSDS